MNIWFTSDFHLSHQNIIGFANRPFSSVEEMNKTIIANFYEKVKSGDVVYFLGDFSFYEKDFEDFFPKIPKGIHFHFIKGNHDRTKLVKKHVKPYVDGTYDMKDIRIGQQKITLCHYPMISWNCSHYGAFCLFGHHHSELSFSGKLMNVGVDLNNYFPVSFEEVVEYMKTKDNNWDLIK